MKSCILKAFSGAACVLMFQGVDVFGMNQSDKNYGETNGSSINPYGMPPSPISVEEEEDSPCSDLDRENNRSSDSLEDSNINMSSLIEMIQKYEQGVSAKQNLATNESGKFKNILEQLRKNPLSIPLQEDFYQQEDILYDSVIDLISTIDDIPDPNQSNFNIAYMISRDIPNSDIAKRRNWVKGRIKDNVKAFNSSIISWVNVFGFSSDNFAEINANRERITYNTDKYIKMLTDAISELSFDENQRNQIKEVIQKSGVFFSNIFKETLGESVLQNLIKDSNNNAE